MKIFSCSLQVLTERNCRIPFTVQNLPPSWFRVTARAPEKGKLKKTRRFSCTDFCLERKDDAAGPEKFSVRKSHSSWALRSLTLLRRMAVVAFCFTCEPAAPCSPLACEAAKKFLWTVYPRLAKEQERSPR